MKKWYRSKTINFNALYLALIAVLKAFDITLPEEAVVAMQTILNIVLRLITNQGIEK